MRFFGKKIVFVGDEKDKKQKVRKKDGLLDDEDFGFSDSKGNKDFLGNWKDNEEKWIDIDITIMCPYTELIRLKKALEPYAEELGWEMESGSNTLVEDNTKVGGGKVKKINVTLRPKEGSISPIEFVNNRDKIIGLLFSIHRDILHGGDHEKATKDFLETININYTRHKFVGDDGFTQEYKPSKEDYTMTENLSFLRYSYKLNDRIKFEKRNKEAALELFKRTVAEDMKDIFKPEEKKTTKPKRKANRTKDKKEKELLDKFGDFEESNKKFKEELRNLFGFDI